MCIAWNNTIGLSKIMLFSAMNFLFNALKIFNSIIFFFLPLVSVTVSATISVNTRKTDVTYQKD